MQSGTILLDQCPLRSSCITREYICVIICLSHRKATVSRDTLPSRAFAERVCVRCAGLYNTGSKGRALSG